MRTGYKFFPYATQQSGQWWVLRFNFGFPEHELYTLFIDGRATLDVTGRIDHPVPLAASIGALQHLDRQAVLTPELAEAAVRPVARFVVYGSEVDDPCDWCDHLAEQDPMTRL